jgi:hypothetical protein
MMYRLGDRVRASLTDGDGLPLVRYGFVRSMSDSSGPVVVMFDDELAGEEIAIDKLEPVTITSLDLRLEGEGLLDDCDLRRGLTSLWQGEAEDAGLDVDGVQHLNGDKPHADGSWTLAHFTSGGERYLLTAVPVTPDATTIRVFAEFFGTSD